MVFRRFILLSGLLLGLSLLMVTAQLHFPAVHAAPLALPTRPNTATPRVVTPTPIPPTTTPAPVVNLGALIQLQASASQSVVWTNFQTVVQWQDALGGWHDVEGWRGDFESNARVSWWVTTRHFGQGPFRWIVYEKATQRVLSISAAFSLPTQVGAIQRVETQLTSSSKK